MGDDFLRYQRSKFSTRLPTDRLYTASHFWLREDVSGPVKVGFTRFATRMLGDPVEFDFEVEVGASVETGQVVGWIEGFKAVTDLYAPMAGVYRGPNPDLDQVIDLMKADPYEKGWLYLVEGRPGEDCLDANGYAAFLDGTIDKMMGTSS